MSLNEEFDELARRKLEERLFPFQEADWLDARSRIDAQRHRRKRVGWIFSAGLLLLMSGLLWQETRPGTSGPTIAMEQKKVDTAPQAMPTNSTAVRSASTSVTTTNSSNTVKGSSAKKAVEEPTAATTPALVDVGNDLPLKNASNSVKTVPTVQVLAKTQATKDIRQATSNEEGGTAALAMGERPTSTTTDQPTDITVSHDQASGPTLATASASIPTAAPARPVSTDAGHETGSPVATPTTSDQGHPTIGGNAGSTPAVIPSSGIAIDKEAAAPKEMGAATVGAPTASASGPPANSNGSLTQQGLGKELAAADATPPTSDSSSTGSPTPPTPNDPAAASPAAPSAEPPLVPERAPWEVTVMGGVFSSTTTYSGGNSADWNSEIGRGRSSGFGAELMHMGRNIGIGTGLHYGNYAERIRTDAIDASSTIYQHYWYLMPVDTTILVFTDTLQQGGPYTGIPVDTTINVLAQGTDTTTSSQHLRDARDQVNRVSYLEVPILLDAHLVQGRWSLGLRGGPTIGLLTGRRGSVPNDTKDGYVAFTDQPFREVVLGYTAGAYIRYRFNAGWSVGVEPMMRGQLLNSLGDGDLTRRSSAKGVLLSLTYRLR